MFLFLLKNKKAFSLIELLIAVAIIGVLIGVGTPVYRKYKANAQTRATVATLTNLNSAAFTLDAEDSTINESGLADLIKGVGEDEIAVKVGDRGDQWCIMFRRSKKDQTKTFTTNSTNGDGCIDQDGEVRVLNDKGSPTCTGSGNSASCTGGDVVTK